MSQLISDKTAALPSQPSCELSEKATGRSERDQSSVVRRGKMVDDGYAVYCKLRNKGTKVDPEEFCACYPASVQFSLMRLIYSHELVEVNLELLDLNLLKDCPGPGTVFLGFHLERELGRGAFARVFRATEQAVGQRQVALKISPRWKGTAEAATLGRMIHPNIVPIYSITEDEQSKLTAVCMPYLGQTTLLHVLEHVHGRLVGEPTAASLLEAIEEVPGAQPVVPSRIFREGSFVDGVRWLAIQLVEALAFIHAKGICHRDLKPSNILLGAGGTPMLLDFNLAEDMQSSSEYVVGTPCYMSPEDLRGLCGIPSGDTPGPDPRSDMYALGVILYELLTGKHPFGPLPGKAKPRDLAAVLLERQKQGFRPLRESRPDVDMVLAGVVEKCLATDSKDRPTCAAEIARALRRSQSWSARASRWVRRRRKTALAACLFSLGTMLGVVFYLSTRTPEHVARVRMGNEAAAKNDFSTAIGHYTESLRTNPNQPDVLFARGQAYAKLVASDRSNFSAARSDFTQADQLSPGGWNKAYIGYCFHFEDQAPAAMTCYLEAIKLGCRTAEVHNNLAELLMKRVKYKEAQEHLEAALLLNPLLQAAYCNQAVLYYRKAVKIKGAAPEQNDLLEKGVASFRKAWELGPLSANMTLQGAALYASVARFDAACTEAALEQLARAIEQGVDPRPWATDRRFTMLADRPAFRALLRRNPPPDHPSIAAIMAVEPVTK